MQKGVRVRQDEKLTDSTEEEYFHVLLNSDSKSSQMGRKWGKKRTTTNCKNSSSCFFDCYIEEKYRF